MINDYLIALCDSFINLAVQIPLSAANCVINIQMCIAKTFHTDK